MHSYTSNHKYIFYIIYKHVFKNPPTFYDHKILMSFAPKSRLKAIIHDTSITNSSFMVSNKTKYHFRSIIKIYMTHIKLKCNFLIKICINQIKCPANKWPEETNQRCRGKEWRRNGYTSISHQMGRVLDYDYYYCYYILL